MSSSLATRTIGVSFGILRFFYYQFINSFILLYGNEQLSLLGNLYAEGQSITEENYNYRISQRLLRNQFSGNGKLKIPMIPKFQEKIKDFDNLLLIGFDKTHLEDQNHLDRMVHFLLYDYHFERVWKKPSNNIEKLSHYRAVLSPNFSMYMEMAPVMQLYHVFRNRWCGAYWASKGLRVIPTVNWGDESTFDFCFE